MDKIQELMEELNKDQMIEEMENMQLNEEAMEKNTERLLELFKNLEVEKDVKDMVEKLEELAKEQEELSEETKKDEKSQEDLQKEQEKLNEEFKELEEKMEEIEKKNEELERPKDLGEDNEEQMDDIKEDMKDSQESLEKKENSKASDKQKAASDKMKKMAQNMQAAMESNEMEQMQEDIAALRQLLENLVTLSFDQEDLIDDLKRTQINTPTYVSQIQTQFKLKDDFELIQDSLQELAKRVDKIASFVTDKVVEINTDMTKSLDQLEERQKPEAESNQRRTMKNVNDLALMLSESMEEMQQQMSGMMAGSQMCNKPGMSGGKSGKVPMDKITEGQKGLNGEMKKMMEGGKDGKDGPSSKDFAEAAARQAALRKALEGMQQEKMEQGKGDKGLQELIEAMDKIETDLVNKRLDNDMLLRQQEIVTRLLEAEKAERQREFDNKRKAETGSDYKKELPPALKEYLKEREAEVEMYKKVSPSLRPYYKKLVDEYYKALKKS
jgi:myosin heavy subunit